MGWCKATRDRRPRGAALLITAVYLLGGAAGAHAQDGAKPEPKPTAPPPAAAKADAKVPPPPQKWLASYLTKPLTEDRYDRLREKLFRTESDADLIRGLTWLSYLPQHEPRTAAAKALACALVLGAQLGADPGPGIRRFAADPHPEVRRALISALAGTDTPLAREILLAHWLGQVPPPKGPAARPFAEHVEEYMRYLADDVELERLRTATRAERAAWCRAAPRKQATAAGNRFEVFDLQTGENNRVEIPGYPGHLLHVEEIEVLRSEPPRVASIDSAMCFVRVELGGATGSGGSLLYSSGCARRGGFEVEEICRYLGEGRVRFWIRALPAGWLDDYVQRRGNPFGR